MRRVVPGLARLTLAASGAAGAALVASVAACGSGSTPGTPPAIDGSVSSSTATTTGGTPSSSSPSSTSPSTGTTGTTSMVSTTTAPSSSSTSRGSSTTSTRPVDGGITLAPPSGDLLTCDKIGLKAEGVGAGAGTWTLSPASGAGTLTPTPPHAGDQGSAAYDTPTSLAAPDGGPVVATVTVATPSGMSTSTYTINTAFPGTPTVLPTTLPGMSEDGGLYDPNAPTTYPIPARFAVNGAHVYAAFNGPTPDGGTMSASELVYASTNGGATFTGPVTYRTSKATTGTVAVDPVKPDLVYLVYDAIPTAPHVTTDGTTVRLAVSENGGHSFPDEYAMIDTFSPGHYDSFVNPDIAAPSANHVLVAGVLSGGGVSWVATFFSSTHGADIGPRSTPGKAVDLNDAGVLTIDAGKELGTEVLAYHDTNFPGIDAGAPSSGFACGIDGVANAAGPRLFTNGAGDVCLVYMVDGSGCTPEQVGVNLQCSTDSGEHWTAPKVVGQPVNSNADMNYPLGAMSPSGNNLAVTWIANTNASGVTGPAEVYVAISTDAGAHFGAPIKYPSASRTAAGGAGAETTLPVVAWQGEGILWLSQSVSSGSNGTVLMVDKTCDLGVSWSGWVSAGAYDGNSLFSAESSMLAGGYAPGNHRVVAIPLTQGLIR